MLYLVNTSNNISWPTTNDVAIRKLYSDLRAGRHTCEKLQLDWDSGHKFVVQKGLPENFSFYRGIWTPPRDVNPTSFYKHCRKRGECLVWGGPTSIYGTTPARIAAYIAGGIIPGGFPVKSSRCKTSNCVRAKHLNYPRPNVDGVEDSQEW